MDKCFLQTTLGTDFEENKSLSDKLVRRLLFFIPEANPGYEGNMHLVKKWVIEFDQEGSPNREVGLNEEGNIVLAGPSERDYGFWIDTNMKFADFTGEVVSKSEFEAIWMESASFRKNDNA